MKNTSLAYFAYVFLFISVMSILLVCWRGLRWMFSDKVKIDTYHDTGLLIVLALGSSVMAAFTSNLG